MSEKNRDAFLGIDTSNYRTSVALYFADGTYQSSRKLLPVPMGEKGLRQSDAVFLHVKQFSEVFSELNFENINIKGVGVSNAPRNTAGSYMPCFSFGLAVAETLAHSYGVECYKFSHQQGHIAAGLLSCGKLEFLNGDFYALHASGGTTEIVLVKDIENIEIVSKTRDISIGQLIDRTGVLLGLPFPSGEALEVLAKKCKDSFKINVKLKDGDCCLSGYENKVKAMLENGDSFQKIASYITEVCGNTIAEMLTYQQKIKKLPVLCAGGVMANERIKSIIIKSFLNSGLDAPSFASLKLSGDNAVGIAYLTYRKSLM